MWKVGSLRSADTRFELIIKRLRSVRKSLDFPRSGTRHTWRDKASATSITKPEVAADNFAGRRGIFDRGGKSPNFGHISEAPKDRPLFRHIFIWVCFKQRPHSVDVVFPIPLSVRDYRPCSPKRDPL